MLKILFRTIIALVFAVSAAQAKIILNTNDKINTASGIDQWTKEIKQKAQQELAAYQSDADGYTECRETAELPDVYLCGTYLQRDMNAFLSRATFYSDGKRQEPVATDNKSIKASLDIILGHDIPGQEFAAFYQKVKLKCDSGEMNYCLTDAEKLFHDKVIQPVSRLGKPFVLIAYSVQTLKPQREIVSHEMQHARYFTNEAYRARVILFWRTRMSDAEHRVIEDALAAFGYDKTIEDTIINEFQAYILQDGARTGRLEKFVPQYQKRLRTFVRTKEVPVAGLH